MEELEKEYQFKSNYLVFLKKQVLEVSKELEKLDATLHINDYIQNLMMDEEQLLQK